MKWNDKPLKTQMTRDVTIIKSVRLKSRLSVSKNGITETVCISSVGLAIGWELLSWKKLKVEQGSQNKLPISKTYLY